VCIHVCALNKEAVTVSGHQEIEGQ